MPVSVSAITINENNSPRIASRRAQHTRMDAAILELWKGPVEGNKGRPNNACLKIRSLYL